MTKFSPIVAKGNFINGSFCPCPTAKSKFDSVSPADQSDIVGNFEFSLETVPAAVESARKAFSRWSATVAVDRLKFIQSIGDQLEEHKENFARLISREVGKPIWESRIEVTEAIKRTRSNPEDMGWCWRQLKSEAKSKSGKFVDYRARGVVAVLAPFNLPLDTSLSYILPALYLGNTVVFKPNKSTPAVAQYLCEIIERAEFPPGVFNMIQGDKEITRRLAQHSGVDVVLFTGPYELGEQIKRDSVDPVDKTLVMETGGKNAAIVWDSADLESSIKSVLFGAMITCGQRSTGTSRVILHRSIAQEFLEGLHERAKKIVIGNPFAEDKIPFMGALISAVSVERYLKFQGIAAREGFESIMRGKSFDGTGTNGFYVTPSIYLAKDNSAEKLRKSVFNQTEIFGPCLTAFIVDTIEEAVALASAGNYTLSASVFSTDRSLFDTFWNRLRVGNIHWNLPTTHQDILLPFGGVGKSGNGLFTGFQLAASLVFPYGGLLESDSRQKLDCPEGTI